MHDVALARVDGSITAGRIEFFFETESLGAQVVFTPWKYLDHSDDSARYRVCNVRRRVPLASFLDAVVSTSDECTIKHVLLPLQWVHAFGA